MGGGNRMDKSRVNPFIEAYNAILADHNRVFENGGATMSWFAGICIQTGAYGSNAVWLDDGWIEEL